MSNYLLLLLLVSSNYYMLCTVHIQIKITHILAVSYVIAGIMASLSRIRSQFITFCNFGAGTGGNKVTLTDKNLTKMFKDCKIYGKSLTTTDTDIAFSKVKEKGKK